ncbi:hypothetical protein [Collinsella sp. AM17-1]|uniref:hypothetical protein n=1 Tax=Collinsella sp. AM17-1 TaxID=2292027 RepID=UPI000E550FFC|nr:hypothetical protein [Collinsella sp. AM17-1]RHH73279.1 hypothetical protein DW195_02040 [Collinsella sp. AM17-1]
MDGESHPIETINDAIEIGEIKEVIGCVPEAFDDMSLEINHILKRLYGKASSFAHSALTNNALLDVYESVEWQYIDRFWNLASSTKAYEKINSDELEELLSRHSLCISNVMSHYGLVQKFDQHIRAVLSKNIDAAVSIIVGNFGAEVRSKEMIYLPPSLTGSDIDEIVLRYLSETNPNLNYVQVLMNWPSAAAKDYSPSIEVRIKAKRRYEELSKQLFDETGSIEYGIEASISGNQIACKDSYVDGNTLKTFFGEEWLSRYLDHPTIMNNCAYVFDYLDERGLLTCPAHEHDESTLMKTFGMRAKDEYDNNIFFKMRQDLLLEETALYAKLLERNGRRLEDAIEWTYNVYFAKELGIGGFSISLPATGCSWLDKCKAMGPELERALKAYSLYSKMHVIDPDYFRFENFKLFSEFKSFYANKYVIRGDRYDEAAKPLFWDQSLLAFASRIKSPEDNLWDLLHKHVVHVDDYDGDYRSAIESLINKGFLAESDKDGRLLPSKKAHYLKKIWDSSAYPLWRCSKATIDGAHELVKQGYLKYSDALFSPDEASYLNYMFNNAIHSNALALRNSYDHGNSPVDDPNSSQFARDYYLFLTLLIEITLKISEELIRYTGNGGDLELIDWPMYGKHLAGCRKR